LIQQRRIRSSARRLISVQKVPIRYLVVLVVAFATFFSGGAPLSAAGRPGETHTVQTRLKALAPPRHGAFLGVAEPTNSGPGGIPQVEGFAKAIGYHPDIVLTYSKWLAPFQSRFAEQARAIGAVTIVQMNPTGISMAKIAHGGYDYYLRSFARAVKSYAGPVIIGFAREMNNTSYSWGRGHTRAWVWVAAWRHVVTVFRQQGALNATWLWTINRAIVHPSIIKSWWPGAAYVTWVGLDGYYFVGSDTFQKSFVPTIHVIRQLTQKPILLSETGIGPRAGQVVKMPDLFAGIKRYHFIGLDWYDMNRSGGLFRQHWRLDGHPLAIAAFRAGLALLGGVARLPRT
jgi:mannan endo-1,4-beta-mannosidase